MPKDTFFNLPDEKRKMIEEAAIDEFAEYEYENASINRIVEACNIAKGSFYQYFDDKKDLYLHIITMIGKEKVKYITPTMQNPQEHDFFTLIRELYISGLTFASSNVRLAKIGNQIVKNVRSPIYQELLDSSLPSSYDVYSGLLQEAIGKGEVRADIDIKYTSYLLTSLSVANFEYWMETHKDAFDIHKYKDTIMEFVDKQLDLLKNGIGSKKGESQS